MFGASTERPIEAQLSGHEMSHNDNSPVQRPAGLLYIYIYSIDRYIPVWVCACLCGLCVCVMFKHCCSMTAAAAAAEVSPYVESTTLA